MEKLFIPTLLLDNDVIILGEETEASEGASPTNLPNIEELKILLDCLIYLSFIQTTPLFHPHP